MAYCIQCGRPVEDDASYCEYCGSVTDPPAPEDIAAGKALYCAVCGSLLPAGRHSCPLCGAEAGASPAAPEYAGTKSDTAQLPILPFARGRWGIGRKPTSVAAEKKRLAAGAFTVSLTLFAVVCALCAWRFLPQILPGKTLPIEEAALYLKENGSLTLYFPDSEPHEVTHSFSPPESADISEAAKASPDGKFLAYLNGDGGLFLLDLTRLRRPDLQSPEGVLIAEQAGGGFDFTRRGNTLVYRTGDILQAYRNGKRLELDTGVDGILSIGERQVLYTKNTVEDGAGARFDLYLFPTDTKPDDRVLIASGVSQVLDYSKGYSAFLYTRPRHEPLTDSYTYEIHHYDAKLKQTSTLASGASQILDASAEQRIVLFAKERPFTLSYGDLVDDPMAEKDSRLKEPDPDYYDLPENYEDLVEGLFNPDVTEELELDDAIFDAYGAYRSAVEEFEKKLERDEARQKIRKSLSSLGSPGLKAYELYLYRNGSAQPLDEDILALNSQGGRLPASRAIQADIEKNCIAYVKSSRADIRPLRLDEWQSLAYDIRGYLGRGIPQRLCWSTLSGTPQTASSTDGKSRITSLAVSGKGDGLFYITTPQGKAGSGALYHIAIGDNTPAEPVIVDMDVNLVTDGAFGGSPLYVKNLSDNRCDLYSADPGRQYDPVIRDITYTPRFTVQSGGKALLYYRNYGQGSNQGYERGELYLFISQERMIIGDVHNYDYRGEKLIYLVRGLQPSGLFDLQVYREGGVTPVDTEVRNLIPIGRNI